MFSFLMLAAIVRPTLRFMMWIVLVCVISSPFVLMFLFDDPSATTMDTVWGGVSFYGFVLIQWFVCALIFNAIRVWMRSRGDTSSS